METLYDVKKPSLRKKQVTKKCGYKLCTKINNNNNNYYYSLASTTRRCILSLVKNKKNIDAGFVNSTASKNPQLTNYEVSASASESPSSPSQSPSSTSATTPTALATQEDESRRSQGQPLERAATTEEQLTMNKPNNTTSHGVISVVGRRRFMDEAVTIVEPGLFKAARPDGPDFMGFDFFGVYNNGLGSHVAANRCKERLHRVVAEQSHSHTVGVGVVDHYWESVMVSSFARMNDEFGSYDNNNDVISGDGLGDVAKPRSAMALVVLVGQEEIVVANCGHSRAVLYGGDGAVVPLSSHHQHEREGDRETSGTRRLKQQMISEPEVTVHKRTISDKFLIIATNGLWRVVTNEMACDIVNKRRSGEVTSKKVKDGVNIRDVADDCAAMLVELALARGSKDNISVIVVELQHLTADVTSSSS